MARVSVSGLHSAGCGRPAIRAAMPLFVVALLFFGTWASALGTVAYHHSASANTGATPANALTIPSFSVPDTSVCAYPALVVAVSIIDDAGNAPALSGVTWNPGSPQGFTFVAGASTNSSTGTLNDNARKRVEMWVLTGITTGTGDITLSFPSGIFEQMVAGAVLACNVDQTSPVAFQTSGNNSGSQGVSAAVGLNTASGALLVDVLAVDGDITPSPAGPSDVAWNVSTGSTLSNIVGASSYENTTGASVFASWSLNTPTYWAEGALVLTPHQTNEVGLEKVDASAFPNGVAVRWHAGVEANNLGYRVYRENGGQRVQVTPDLVMGSGFRFGPDSLAAGYSYGWWDPAGTAGSRYWLEDIALDGTSSMHGPYATQTGVGEAPVGRRAPLLGQTMAARAAAMSSVTPASMAALLLNLAPASMAASVSGLGSQHLVRTHLRPVPTTPTQAQIQQQWTLAGAGAAKILVRQEGWYRVSESDLAAAGFDLSGRDSRFLRLFADGKEQAIRVNGADDGSFDPGDSIEFYGVPQDTPSSGSRVYWLVSDTQRGARIGVVDASSTSTGNPLTYPFTVQLKPRLVYVPGVLNGDKENFFGPAVSATPVPETMTVSHLDANASAPAALEVALQGFTAAAYQVRVDVNGTTVGAVSFTAAGWQNAVLSVPLGSLREGGNTISLVTEGNSNAIALVDYINLTYPRVSTADGNALAVSVKASSAGSPFRIDGFTNANIRVFDVSADGSPAELAGDVSPVGAGYAVTLDVPSRLTAAGATSILAFTDDQALHPAAITVNEPSSWHLGTHAADEVMIAAGDFIPSLGPLQSLRESQGLKVAVVNVEDIYDEFNFGNKSPQAIRDFLARATKAWATPPRFVLLVGEGTYDPRDYLGLGQDYVPTKLVDSASLETASDDWFADFNNTGVPMMALGRLPVISLAQASSVVAKIVGYETSGATFQNALFVADAAIGTNFAAQNKAILALVPPSINVAQVNVDDLGQTQARTAILTAINAGTDLVEYSGHGTIDYWRGNLLTDDDAPTLTNANRLSVFTIMNCLNGVFQEPLLEGLGEALLKAPNGGAVAVWASSGTTLSSGQQGLVKSFISTVTSPGNTRTLGEAAMAATAATSDLDVRRTWIFLGDPATRLR